MSSPRRSTRARELSGSLEERYQSKVMDTRIGAVLQSKPAQKGIKRENSAREESGSLETSKPKLLKSEMKSESGGGALCDHERRKMFQCLIEEVYFRRSLAESYSPRDESPNTPLLSHCASQDVSRFMESFSRAYPSEYEDLIVLLDAFSERRCTFD